MGPWLVLAKALLTKALALEAAVGAASATALLLVPACRDDQPYGFIVTIKTWHCVAAVQLFKCAQYNQ